VCSVRADCSAADRVIVPGLGQFQLRNAPVQCLVHRIHGRARARLEKLYAEDQRLYPPASYHPPQPIDHPERLKEPSN